MSADLVLGTMPGSSFALCCLIFATILYGRVYCCPHRTDEEVMLREVKSFVKGQTAEAKA